MRHSEPTRFDSLGRLPGALRSSRRQPTAQARNCRALSTDSHRPRCSLEEDRAVHGLSQREAAVKHSEPHHLGESPYRFTERPCAGDEHGFTGKETIVKDYVRERRLRRREMFVPLVTSSGPCSSGLWRALDAIIAGVKYRAHFFVMTLPHSDACFVAAYPAATTEAWLSRAQQSLCFFRRRSPIDSGTTTTSVWCRASCQMARGNERGRSSGLQSHYHLRRTAIGPVIAARVTTKAMWRGWSAMPGGTS